jgi:hypothetical protein
VLHEAVGNVPMMLIASRQWPDRMIYAGPTLTHYEFEEPGVRRLSDDEWKIRLSCVIKDRVPSNGHVPISCRVRLSPSPS